MTEQNLDVTNQSDDLSSLDAPTTTFVLPEEDLYPSKIIAISNLGIVTSKQYGDAHKIRVYFGNELTRQKQTAGGEVEDCTDDEGNVEPYIFSSMYTFSFGPKSSLNKKLLAPVLGLTSDEVFQRSLKPGIKLNKELLGLDVLLDIQHQDSREGKTYANVANIRALRAKDQPCDLTDFKISQYVMAQLGDAKAFWVWEPLLENL